MRLFHACVLALNVFGTLSLVAQSSVVPLSSPPMYHLQVGDAFEVRYRLTPEYNQTVSVLPDGSVTLQLLGSIPVRGLTIPEARDTLEQAAGKRLRNPDLSLELKNYVKAHFTVLGEVGSPGQYELHGTTSVQDGVAVAGGFKVSARHTNILLIHRVNDTTGETNLIDFKKLEKPHPGMELLSLRPGDIIIVPMSKLSKVERYVKLVNAGVYFNPLNP